MKSLNSKRYLQIDTHEPVKAVEVHQAAATLADKYNTAELAELVTDGRLPDTFPYTAELPQYQPKQARRRPTKA